MGSSTMSEVQQDLLKKDLSTTTTAFFKNGAIVPKEGWTKLDLKHRLD